MYTDRSTQEWIDGSTGPRTFEKIIGKRAVAAWPRPAISRWTRPRSGTSNWGFRYSSSMRDDRPYRTRASREGVGFHRIPARWGWMTIQPSSTALPHRSPRARTGSPATGGPLQLAA